MAQSGHKIHPIEVKNELASQSERTIYIEAHDQLKEIRIKYYNSPVPVPIVFSPQLIARLQELVKRKAKIPLVALFNSYENHPELFGEIVEAIAPCIYENHISLHEKVEALFWCRDSSRDRGYRDNALEQKIRIHIFLCLLDIESQVESNLLMLIIPFSPPLFVLQTLYDVGAIELKDQNETIFHKVARAHYSENEARLVLKFFLTINSSLYNKKNRHGKIPLEVALESMSSSAFTCVIVLLEFQLKHIGPTLTPEFITACKKLASKGVVMAFQALFCEFKDRPQFIKQILSTEEKSEIPRNSIWHHAIHSGRYAVISQFLSHRDFRCCEDDLVWALPFLFQFEQDSFFHAKYINCFLKKGAMLDAKMIDSSGTIVDVFDVGLALMENKAYEASKKYIDQALSCLDSGRYSAKRTNLITKRLQDSSLTILNMLRATNAGYAATVYQPIVSRAEEGAGAGVDMNDPAIMLETQITSQGNGNGACHIKKFN